MTIAVIQMTSSTNIADNLQQAWALLKKAKQLGAELVVLPENFASLGRADVQAIGEAEAQGQGVILPWLYKTAAELGLWIQAGTIPLPPDNKPKDKVRACALLVDDKGQRVARYDKLHLFDAAVADKQHQYLESAIYDSGEQIVVVDTPVGRLGLTVCYDLRFAELYTLLRNAGAELISVPSAFTVPTGQAHWQVLLRARAIETQCYILAAAQSGMHSEQRVTWGHSCIVDPWGNLCAEQSEGTGVLSAERQIDQQNDIRASMPVTKHRRLTVAAGSTVTIVESL